MKKVPISKQFYEFLVEENILDKFMENLYNVKNPHFENYLKICTNASKETEPRKISWYFIQAFKFDDTPEGRDFWVGIQNVIGNR